MATTDPLVAPTRYRGKQSGGRQYHSRVQNLSAYRGPQHPTRTGGTPPPPTPTPTPEETPTPEAAPTPSPGENATPTPPQTQESAPQWNWLDWLFNSSPSYGAPQTYNTQLVTDEFLELYGFNQGVPLISEPPPQQPTYTPSPARGGHIDLGTPLDIGPPAEPLDKFVPFGKQAMLEDTLGDLYITTEDIVRPTTPLGDRLPEVDYSAIESLLEELRASASPTAPSAPPPRLPRLSSRRPGGRRTNPARFLGQILSEVALRIPGR